MVKEMFEIRLIDRSERSPDGQRLGVITVGDFVERFACHAADGSDDSMPHRWRESLRSLLNGQSSVALVYDPRFAWIVYREEEECFVQQRVSLNTDFQNIPPRETVTEGDQQDKD